MSTNQHAVLPPPYEPNGNRDPSQPVPATNLYVHFLATCNKSMPS